MNRTRSNCTSWTTVSDNFAENRPQSSGLNLRLLFNHWQRVVEASLFFRDKPFLPEQKGGLPQIYLKNRPVDQASPVYLQTFGLDYNRYTQKWRISIDKATEVGRNEIQRGVE